MTEARTFSFELNTDMLRLLRQEFDVHKLVGRFAEAISGEEMGDIEAIGRQIFEEYGREWIRRSLQLGEEYPDRTYEVLKAAIDKTGGYYRFALLPQRFLEIAYLGTQDIFTLPIVENNANRLIYRMVDCLTFKTMKERCGEAAANLLTCKHACLTAIETLHRDLDLDAIIDMEASMVKDGYCQFAIRKP